MISDGENNFMQNKFYKWKEYRKVLPKHKNGITHGIIRNLYTFCRRD